jgi:hypothetical protein
VAYKVVSTVLLIVIVLALAHSGLIIEFLKR